MPNDYFLESAVGALVGLIIAASVMYLISISPAAQHEDRAFFEKWDELLEETQHEDTPKDFEPVLAEVAHTNSLGRSRWFEVVYYAEGSWNCYAGSRTFKDGEVVLRWRYAEDAIAA